MQKKSWNVDCIVFEKYTQKSLNNYSQYDFLTENIEIFYPAFRVEFDESFLRFFSLTLVLVDSILLLDV